MNDQPYLVSVISVNADELDLRALLMRQFEKGVVKQIERATNLARRNQTLVDLRATYEAYRLFRQELDRWAVETFGAIDEFDYPTSLSISREQVAECIGLHRARRLSEETMLELAEKFADGLRQLESITLNAVLEGIEKDDDEDEATPRPRYHEMSLEQFRDVVDILRMDAERWQVISRIEFTRSNWRDGERTDAQHAYPVTLGICFEQDPDEAIANLHQALISNARLEAAT